MSEVWAEYTKGVQVKVPQELIALQEKWGVETLNANTPWRCDVGAPEGFQQEHDAWKEKWWFREFSRTLPYKKAREAANEMPKIQFRNTPSTLLILDSVYYTGRLHNSERWEHALATNLNSLVRITPLGKRICRCSPRNRLEFEVYRALEGLVMYCLLDGSITLGKLVERESAVIEVTNPTLGLSEAANAAKPLAAALVFELVEVCGYGIYKQTKIPDQVKISILRELGGDRALWNWFNDYTVDIREDY